MLTISKLCFNQNDVIHFRRYDNGIEMANGNALGCRFGKFKCDNQFMNISNQCYEIWD